MSQTSGIDSLHPLEVLVLWRHWTETTSLVIVVVSAYNVASEASWVRWWWRWRGDGRAQQRHTRIFSLGATRYYRVPLTKVADSALSAAAGVAAKTKSHQRSTAWPSGAANWLRMLSGREREGATKMRSHARQNHPLASTDFASPLCKTRLVSSHRTPPERSGAAWGYFVDYVVGESTAVIPEWCGSRPNNRICTHHGYSQSSSSSS